MSSLVVQLLGLREFGVNISYGCIVRGHWLASADGLRLQDKPLRVSRQHHAGFAKGIPTNRRGFGGFARILTATSLLLNHQASRKRVPKFGGNGATSIPRKNPGYHPRAVSV